MISAKIRLLMQLMSGGGQGRVEGVIVEWREWVIMEWRGEFIKWRELRWSASGGDHRRVGRSLQRRDCQICARVQVEIRAAPGP